MPLVAIDLLEVRSSGQIDAIPDAVHEAMVESFGVPERDRFQLITEHQPRTLRFDRGFLDIDRGDGFVLVRITLAAGRDSAVKRRFYGRCAELLAERAGVRSEDLTVVLVENNREDWSFGMGEASFLELPRHAWR